MDMTSEPVPLDELLDKPASDQTSGRSLSSDTPGGEPEKGTPGDLPALDPDALVDEEESIDGDEIVAPVNEEVKMTDRSEPGYWLLHRQGSALVFLRFPDVAVTKDGFKVNSFKDVAIRFTPLNSTDELEGFPPDAAGSAVKITRSLAFELDVPFEDLLKKLRNHKAYGANFAFWDDKKARKTILDKMFARAAKEQAVFNEALTFGIPRSNLTLPSQRRY